MWSVVGTWPFSLQLTEKVSGMLAEGARALDALEVGVHLVESDPNVDSVGRGGYLNANGELELDAAIMDGDTLRMGCVASVRGFEHPITIARKVMEETVHAVIVGEGAEAFARKMGIPEVGNEYMTTDNARAVWEMKKKEGHDTIGAVALDTRGSMGVAMSTSGANMKVPGRVGDTPIIGSGFYVESGVGGAAATGLGEDIMRTCLAFRTVDLMRRGMSPKEAAAEAILTAHNTMKRHGIDPDNIAVVCMDAEGNTGASCNHRGFYYSYAREGQPPVLEPVEPVIDNERYGAGALGFLESDNMSEFYEVVDNAGSPRGQLRYHHETPDVNECRPVAEAWVRDPDGNYLITKADGCWKTASGIMIAGEDGRQAALRVAKEQFGLELDTAAGRIWRLQLQSIPDCAGKDLVYVSIFRLEAACDTVGADDKKWVSPEELRRMAEQGLFKAGDHLDALLSAE